MGFELIPAEKSGIQFANTITENDSINILDLEYTYNGGGVAIEDFNQDGLPDIFFTGNRVGNYLYLNKGELQFEDISATAGISGNDKWSTGVAVVDINNDGLKDIYVGASISNDPLKRANMLFINKGAGKDGKPVFEDQAFAYNLADTGHTTHAVFFDYDNDGDLDCYILTNKVGADRYPNQYKQKQLDGTAENTDRLYRNDFDSSKGHPVFTNVSKEAGILQEGYGLGVAIADINGDGWKDIYVTNDFLTNDILWINNKDGSFTNRVEQYFKHTSYSAMGNDVADINNDGLPDLIAVDMLPASNDRKKMMMAANSYQNYLNNEEFGYQYQYVRNTLQLNLGPAWKDTAGTSHPVFGDIAFYAGVAETDWSWAPLFVDFDNDGWRDLMITNGYPKDITDRDFMTYRASANKIAPKEMILDQIPEVKLSNFIFKNSDGTRFTDQTSDWNFDSPSFSSGAAYGDLDNDGDMDLVINNTNQVAMVYKNKAIEKLSDNQYLQVQLEGPASNRDGFGAKIEIHQGDSIQVTEFSPYRGYLSTMQDIIHFGLGKQKQIDKLLVTWPDGKVQQLENLPANQRLVLHYKDAMTTVLEKQEPLTPLFTNITESIQPSYLHQEYDYSDFNVQKLLPHKLSEFGPAMAAEDLDENGLTDLVIGGSFGYSANILLQQKDGSYQRKELIPAADAQNKPWEDMGILLFDAEKDGDLDLYITSGGYELEVGSNNYRDHFYLNDGKGNFTEDSTAIPLNTISKSCVRAADMDGDGDLDLLLAGRVKPWNYPLPVSSTLLLNESGNGKVQFRDATKELAAELQELGMVCDAIWTDIDNDNWPDLLLAGEWMPVTIFKNERGNLKRINETGLEKKSGWWNSIAPGDFDNDGDIDYVVSNLGLNSFYRASDKEPVRIYAGDFDNNKSLDAIPTLYLPNAEGQRKEFPAQTRDDLIKQMISLRRKFQNYKLFSTAGIREILNDSLIQTAWKGEVNQLASVYIENKGNGKFSMKELPMLAQVSMLNGMFVEDLNGDGNLDLISTTNDYGTEVSVGRYDALNGLVLLGDGSGNFSSLSIASSGFYVPGNGKSVVCMVGPDQSIRLAVSQNRGALQWFNWKGALAQVQPASDDTYAIISLTNGKQRKQERYWGSGFLSQSPFLLFTNQQVKQIEYFSGSKTGSK
jgi:hypothetical protein